MVWEPTPSDIEWTKTLVSKIKDGGSWGVPESCAIFTFFHSKKEYTLLEMAWKRGHSTTKRIVKVLDGLGWKERE